ncbi:MAG: hypothetical protein KF901_30790 [Myxococcales bacterium]|nr:hypothetical protein [Myxococcales bacterium]
MTLEPAQYETPKRTSFGPRLPWKWIFPIALAIALMVGFYNWRDRSQTHTLRQTISALYEANVPPVRARVSTFRERVEAWIQEAGAEAPETWVDPRLDLAGLHRVEGIYLRLHQSQTVSPEAIAEGAKAMGPDAIARCLGLAPISMRGFYARADMLDPAWIDEVQASDDVLRLQVLEEQLRNRVARDFPVLVDTTRAAYFLLTIQHGESRRDAPVDVFLWDLQRQTPLLRTRVQARGSFIPARIAVGGAAAGAAAPLPETTGLVDCSIATQVRAATGHAAPEVRSQMPVGVRRTLADEDETGEARAPSPVEGEAAAAEGEAATETATEAGGE